MRYELMEVARHREADAPATTAAIAALLAAGYDVRRPANNAHQLKVTASLSYYPTTGVLFVDGHAKPLEPRGLEALFAVLRSVQLARSR
ncbi:hypothetical protein IAG41_09830 [Sphingomonas sp. JC676]|uniref:hypothetical protein n=1 Tax=Sphingomonas sp. JC676 TaxID=2768065 RepID=UPI0016577F18|nr:hypothetical protein [Sphingomonas sp. JC676]MBC9032691.1 hypothetical protein [Sphingomonas sp. JC676]